MSVGAPQVEETTPVPVTKPVDSTITTAETTEPFPDGPPKFALGTTEPIENATENTPATETTKDEVVVEAIPATEGLLGYKAPGLLKQFRYVKHFFWFGEEPLTQQALDSYVKNEKAELAHHNAAWAQETGKGVLFFVKRAEDKATPSGIILLHEATAVTKVGITDFSFKVGSHTHKFEATTHTERDSWVVAIQKIVEESKDLKADITNRESYKKTIGGYSFSPAIAGSSASPIKHDTPKKSLDANTATAAAVTHEPAAKIDTSSASSVDESKKNKHAEKQAKKERSQSRKRNSVFGLFGKKDEEKDVKKAEKVEKEHEKEAKKAEKEHEKDVKRVEKEHIKEEKKTEAEYKKEEAKATHDSTKAKEAAEAAAIVAAPAAVATSVERHEEKKEERPIEKTEEAVSPSEKKTKRASVFGGFFGKNKVTSPSTERTEQEVVPIVQAKDETSAVSETAPKLDEPIHTKPIDAAAVTALGNHTETTTTPAVAATEEPKSIEPAAVDSTITPRTEKKGFFGGFMKKHEKKEEPREEIKTNEDAVKEVAPVAATEPVVEPVAETPVKGVEAPKEERPAREKRRASLFGSLGTLKRKTDKSPEPVSASGEEVKSPETKREKSPMPSKLGGLFRKPSRAVKTDHTAEEVKAGSAIDATKTETGVTAPTTNEATLATTETPANATIVEPKGESEIVGDIVPDGVHTTFHDVVTTKPEEVKASA